MSTVFDGATLLVTGGTGSFGNAVIKNFLYTNIGQIRIFSRDEKSRMICDTSFRQSIQMLQKK